MDHKFSSVQDLLAGANYVDQEVVVDGNYISSRTPADEPAFIRETQNKLQMSSASLNASR